MDKQSKESIKYWLTHHPFPNVDDIVEMYQEQNVTKAEVNQIIKEMKK